MANTFKGFDFNKQSQQTVTPATNLEMNKKVAAQIEARVYGIANVILNNPDMALYNAQGFEISCAPFPSTKGDLYYNFVIRDTTVAEGEKNEVARIRVASVINGESTIDNRFSMFLATIRKELNNYVVEKKLNFWKRNENKKFNHVSLESLKIG